MNTAQLQGIRMMAGETQNATLYQIGDRVQAKTDSRHGGLNYHQGDQGTVIRTGYEVGLDENAVTVEFDNGKLCMFPELSTKIAKA